MMRFKALLSVATLVVLLGMTGAMGRVAAASAGGLQRDGPGPGAVEDAFFAGFESEPAGMSSNFFALGLGGVVFNFTFAPEGDEYGLFGFSHQTTFGIGGSGSLQLRSGAINYDTMERVVIARDDGQDFTFGSIFVNNRGGAPVTVTAYDNGQQAGDAQVVGTGAAVTLNFGGLVVDELHITSADFYEVNVDAFQGNTAADKDYGDLPAEYGLTTDADDGARHPLGAVYLGACVDGDVDGQPSQLANGDDGDGVGVTNGVCSVDYADEDGIVAGNQWQHGAGGGSTLVTVSGGDGCLGGWIDWAGDGSFSQVGDHVVDMVPLSAGEHTVTFDVPAGVFTGAGSQLSFYSRWRLIADAGSIGDCSDDVTLAATGPAANGEVEDYLWQFSPTAVSVTHVSVRPQSASPTWMASLILVLLTGVTLQILGLRARQWRRHRRRFMT